MFCGLYAILQGKDVNWDLQNYHEYAGWALIHGRYRFDVLAGNWQSYLNPILYLARYFTLSLGPAASAATLAVFQGGALIALHLLSKDLFRHDSIQIKNKLAILSTLLAIVSPVFLSELGTSFIDSIVVIPILLSLYLLNRINHRFISVLGAGLLMGSAVGLKMTNALFVPGFALAALIGLSSWKERLIVVLVVGVGGATGIVLTAGPWAYAMWYEFGNPLFPLFGPLLGAGESYIGNPHDPRFLPAGLSGILTLPLTWARGIQSTAEMPFRDIRPLILVLLLAVLGLVRLLHAPLPERTESAHPVRRFWTFLVLGAAMWIGQIAIHRYAIVLELMMGPALVLSLALWFRTQILPAASAALFVASVATIDVPSWGRVSTFGDSSFEVQLPSELANPLTYILHPTLGAPLGFLAPSFPDGSVFIQAAYASFVPKTGILGRRATTAIQDALPDRLYVLTDTAPTGETAITVAGDRFRVAGRCLEVTTAIRPVWACQLLPLVER